MVVRAIWEFDVDDSDGESLQQCIDLAKIELENQLKKGDLSEEDFNYEVRPDLPTIYQTPIKKAEQCRDKEPYRPEVPLVAVIHQYPEGDYSAWELPTLSDEDARKIDEILEKYSNKGCSVRSIDYDALFQ